MVEPVHAEIVIVDDDAGHRTLVRRNLQRAGVTATIHEHEDAAEAMAWLQADECPRRLVLLLDINMPGMSGVEVLRRLRADARHRATPVMMLTTTDDQREVQRCYELGCNAYIAKPIDIEGFIDTVRRLGHFIHVMRLPSRDP